MFASTTRIKRRMVNLLVGLAVLSLAACATGSSTRAEAHEPEIVVRAPLKPFLADWDGKSAGAEWTDSVLLALQQGYGATLLSQMPADAKTFCDNFSSLDSDARKQFWITLISAVARRESSFDPHTRYDEPGLTQDSIGLLQLSLSDAGIYGCAFTNEADIEVPAKNLDCGVRILAKLVAKAGRIGGGGNTEGGAKYWSTLRDKPKNLPSRTYIISKTKLSRGCAS